MQPPRHGDSPTIAKKMALGLLTCAAFAWIAVAAAAPGTINVDGGEISGTAREGVRVFKGIPFAAPPVGDLRWKAPQPVAAWSGVKHADTFGAQCMQTPYPAGSPYATEPAPTSEDCLYLNVWTAGARGDKRPVMVWIHGGAWTRGSGSTPAYDGAALAKKGVVVVTTNYRLGAFGFLAHPELTAESPQHASGNYAILDHIAALTWVQKNIAAFGGDPGRVTIFGESAGSWSVNVMQATPLAKGLFHRAIGESGGQFARIARLADAEKGGVAMATAVGAHSLAALRSVPADRILAAQFRTGVNVDGYVLPEAVRTIFANTQQSSVPVLIGSNANEWTTLSSPAQFPKTLDAYRKYVAAQFGDAAGQIDEAYPVKTEADIPGAMLGMGRDRTFTLEMRTWARMVTAAGQRAYLYQFTHVPPGPHPEWGAYHASEIVYAFNNVGTRPLFQAADRGLADRMSSYWVNFATTGDPNGKGLPAWSSYDAASEPYLELGDTIVTKQHLLKTQLDFLERSQARSASPAARPNAAREAEARAPIDAFFKAFNARDSAALRLSLHYPHVRINEQGGVNIWSSAADAVTNFDGLTTSEGWARSTLDSVTMRQNDDVKVHFEVVFSRYKADGTKYATYQSLWMVTKKEGAWGVQARSSFAP